MSAADLMTRVRNELGMFKFLARTELQFQEQVIRALAQRGLVVESEVAVKGGRYDISVRDYDAHVVLELKIQGSPSDIERQAQRYAMHEGVHAVMIVTTSRRIAASIRSGTLPGPDGARKPFEVLAVRTM